MHKPHRILPWLALLWLAAGGIVSVMEDYRAVVVQRLLCPPTLLRALILLKGVSARFVEFSHLLSDLKAGFDAGQGSASRIDPLVEVDVLGIPEPGHRRGHADQRRPARERLGRRRRSTLGCDGRGCRRRVGGRQR